MRSVSDFSPPVAPGRRLPKEFPDRTVTLVVPFAAGGSTDVVARIIAQKMSDDLGQQVDRRKRRRSRRQSRRGPRGTGRARWLHDPDGHGRDARAQPVDPQDQALRCGEGFRARLAAGARAQRARGQSRAAGKERRGAVGAAEGGTRPSIPMRRPATARRCTSPANSSRAWPASACSTSPTRAPARR